MNVYVPPFSAGTWYWRLSTPVEDLALEDLGARRVLDRDVVRRAGVLVVELDHEWRTGRRRQFGRGELDPLGDERTTVAFALDDGATVGGGADPKPRRPERRPTGSCRSARRCRPDGAPMQS